MYAQGTVYFSETNRIFLGEKREHNLFSGTRIYVYIIIFIGKHREERHER